jgi:hypothetical protein
VTIVAGWIIVVVVVVVLCEDPVGEIPCRLLLFVVYELSSHRDQVMRRLRITAGSQLLARTALSP